MKTFTFSSDKHGVLPALNPILQPLQSYPVLSALVPYNLPDCVAAVLFFLGALGYVLKGHLWDRPDPHYSVWFERSQLLDGASNSKTATTRNVEHHLEESEYKGVIFWGSQSGTAERFAETLGREFQTRFGINMLDLSDYDADSLVDLQETYFAIFLPNDAEGDTEDDFQSWKDNLFAFFRGLGYEQKAVAYQPTVRVEFGQKANENDDSVHQSSVHHQRTSMNSAIYPIPIRSSRELFTAGYRNCVQMEFDLGNNALVYKTGDHIGIWPCNPEEEVERLSKTLGISDWREDTLDVTVLDNCAKPKVPSGSTIQATLRHHLEICASVSRTTILDLAQFAPTAEAKFLLTEIGQDRLRGCRRCSATSSGSSRPFHDMEAIKRFMCRTE
ncbi:hypothetical protein ACEQ8H_005901 [Pleosporales sp. CAS-2024a]